MAPAITPGDHVIMENFSFLRRQPRRGDIVIFQAIDFPSISPKTSYDKRVAGEPGEHLEISSGKLSINGVQMICSNRYGPIHYDLPAKTTLAIYTNLIVPTNEYYVMGDNSTNSLDSRYFGCVPREKIKGRVWLCYWPPSRIGLVK